MAQLAIKGHETRGKEVIELLEMMGGKNYVNHSGNRNVLYFIHNSGEILADFVCLGSNYFTLEEFEKKFPYKIGDKVQHKGATSCGSVYEVDRMQWIDNHVEYTIKRLWYWNDYHTVTAKDLQPYKEETMEKRKYTDLRLDVDQDDKLATEATIDGNKIIPPENHLIGKITRVDNGMLVEFVKKQPVYPKTYKECCGILGMTYDYPDIKMVSIDECSLYSSFIELIRCRNAYWKIVGEQMGLCKPWEPDWVNNYQKKWLINFYQGEINFTTGPNVQFILAFPTEEMRDAFYENFKELIEKCKELL